MKDFETDEFSVEEYGYSLSFHVTPATKYSSNYAVLNEQNVADLIDWLIAWQNREKK